MRRLLNFSLVLALLAALLVPATASAQTDPSTVVIGMGQEPDRLYNSGMFVGVLAQNLVYDNLLGVDDRMTAYPALAVEIPTLENGGATFVGEGMDRALQVTFRLREGVYWSDGTPFTSRDVKYFLELMLNPESGFDTSLESKYDRIETPDDLTVVITYLSANAARKANPEEYADQTDPVIDPLYFFGIYGSGFLYPAHKLAEIAGPNPRTSKDVTKIDSSDFARNPVGTGPYVLQSWEAGTQLTFVANPMGSWRGTPKIPTVVFRITPDKNTLIAQLEAGEIDVITSDSLDAGDSAVLDTLPNARGYYVTGTVWEHLTLNLRNPILADQKVRTALYYGLNRQELNDIILFGKGEVAHSQIPSWSWAYNPDVFKYEYNPDRANALLDAAGWDQRDADGIRVKDGKRLSLKYWSTPSAFRPRQLPLVKEQLSKIGIELNIEFIPARVYFDAKASSPQALSAGQFEVAEFAWVGGYDPGADLKYSMHSINIPTKENNYRGGNYGAYRNPTNDKLLDLGLKTLNQAERVDIYKRVQYILMEDLPVLPIFLRPVTTAAANNLMNFRPSMSSSGETWNIEQWEKVSQ